MNLANKQVVVLGLGATGVATATFLKNRGAVVTATDVVREAELPPKVLSLREKGVRLELGQHQAETVENAELVVISPGVPLTVEPVVRARALGIPVWSEIELAARFIKEPIVAITGTNGKTTTTTLVGDMLRKSGLAVFVGGNIGPPLIGYLDSGTAAQVVVAEISSFQLDTIERFRPQVAVLLNIADDHLDRYPDFDAYARSKARILENQKPEDFAVLNASDPRVAAFGHDAVGQRLYFGRSGTLSGTPQIEGAVVTDTAIVLHSRLLQQHYSDNDEAASDFEAVIPRSAIRLLGGHNLENAAAAALAALAGGGSMRGIRATLREFGGLPHRLEYVATVNGVRYYDDSKATNVDAVVRALECFSEPIILLLGGRSKGADFTPLAESIRRRVRHLILFGEARPEINAAVGGIVATTDAETMAEVVTKAGEMAASGDVVLLSPGCASFDMYENYARRGEDFRRRVEGLKSAA